MDLVNQERNRTYRDGAGGVTVWVISPALIIPFIPRPEVSNEKDHPSRLLVVPSLLPLPLPPLRLLEGQPAPGPLDAGCGDPRDPALEHRLRPLLNPD